MSFESSNELRTVMDGGERLKDTGLAPFPAGEAGQVPTAIGWGMAVSAHSKQPEAAWYFVQWATSPEIQKRMALQGIAPPRPAVANDPEYRKWIDEQPVRKEWQAALDVLATKGSSEVGYPIVANPAIARVHRPGRAGPDPRAKDRRSGLRRRRQGARRTDRARSSASALFGDPNTTRTLSIMAHAANVVTPDRQRTELAALSAPGRRLHAGDDRVSRSSIRSGSASIRSPRRQRQSFVGARAITSKLIADGEFWHGLWVTLALYAALAGAATRVRASGSRCCCSTPSGCRGSCGRCSFRPSCCRRWWSA